MTTTHFPYRTVRETLDEAHELRRVVRELRTLAHARATQITRFTAALEVRAMKAEQRGDTHEAKELRALVAACMEPVRGGP